MPGDTNYWRVSTFVLPVLLDITMHLVAHGWIAKKLGDNTAYEKERVSFNPLRHIDLFGTIILPALLVVGRAPFIFGWAKPVPVYFQKLRRPRREMVIVAAAGPFANLVLAVGPGMLLHVTAFFSAGAETWLEQTLRNGIFVHVFLAVFNMLPILPLDGGRGAVGLSPKFLARSLARLERYGFFILLAVMLGLLAIFEVWGGHFGLFSTIILPVTDTLYNVVIIATGHI